MPYSRPFAKVMRNRGSVVVGAVDLQPVWLALVLPHHRQSRGDVAQQASLRAPVERVADGGVEPDAGDVQKVPIAQESDVDRGGRSAERARERGLRRLRKIETARGAVARSRRHDPERRVGADERPGDEIHGAVAAPCDDDVGTRAHESTRELDRVRGRSRDHDVARRAGTREQLLRKRGAARPRVRLPSSASRRRIDDDAGGHSSAIVAV